MNRFRILQSHPDRLSYIIFAIYLALYPGTLLVVLFDVVPANGAVFGGVLLALQGLSVAAWLYSGLGRRAVVVIAGIVVGSCVVEYVGATYDVPFGAYDYTAQLGYRVASTVPAVILLAWLFSTVGTWAAAYVIAPHAPRMVRAALAGLFIVFFDLQIEPVATIIHQYWVWIDRGWYYGVPWVNFAGWWLTGTIFAYLFDPYFIARLRTAVPPHPLPFWHLFVCMGLFFAMNGRAGLWLAATWSVLGMLGIVFLKTRWVALTQAHRHEIV